MVCFSLSCLFNLSHTHTHAHARLQPAHSLVCTKASRPSVTCCHARRLWKTPKSESELPDWSHCVWHLDFGSRWVQKGSWETSCGSAIWGGAKGGSALTCQCSQKSGANMAPSSGHGTASTSAVNDAQITQTSKTRVLYCSAPEMWWPEEETDDCNVAF